MAVRVRVAVRVGVGTFIIMSPIGKWRTGIRLAAHMHLVCPLGCRYVPAIDMYVVPFGMQVCTCNRYVQCSLWDAGMYMQ